jgi:putative transposase
MPRRVKLEAHLTLDELSEAIATSRDPVQRHGLRAIGLLQAGSLAREVAEELGRSPAWVSIIVRKYNGGGPQALRDARHNNPGRALLFDEHELQRIKDALQNPPEEGGRWSGAKLVRWVKAHLGRTIHKSRGSEYLRRLGHRRVPLAPAKSPSPPAETDATAHKPFQEVQRPRPAGLPFAETPYPSDLTDAQWAILEPLLPATASDTDPHQVMNAVLYVLRTGCPWAYLPRDFPPVSTVKTHFYGWVESGVWEEVVGVLRERWRVSVGREVCPSLGLIDSQAVKTSEKGGLGATTAARKSAAESGTSS